MNDLDQTTIAPTLFRRCETLDDHPRRSSAMRTRFSSVFLLVFFSTASLVAQNTATRPRSPQERAAQRLQAFKEKHRIPGLSIAVGQNGKVIWAEAFGVADLETKSAVTTESVFPLGSTSKTLTSLALGELVEARKLDLDAPIQKYVPYFPKKDHVITARLLAGHLAGVRDYNMAAGEYLNTKEFASVKDAVAVFKDHALLFEPGTKHAYSAYNFVLLSAAIEGASGKDFLTFVQDRLLTPLELERTGPDRASAPSPGLVTSYTNGLFGIAVKAPAVNVSNKWAAGGFVSTPTEMVKLGNAILAGKIVKPETFLLLTTPQKLKDGSDSGAGYAMGWRSGHRAFSPGNKLRVVHHGGAANGAMSFFFIIPERGLVVSMQGNLLFNPFTDFSNEAFAIAAIFLFGK